MEFFLLNFDSLLLDAGSLLLNDGLCEGLDIYLLELLSLGFLEQNHVKFGSLGSNAELGLSVSFNNFGSSKLGIGREHAGSKRIWFPI